MSVHNDIGKLVKKLRPLFLIIEHILVVQMNQISLNKRPNVTSKPSLVKASLCL